MSVNLAIVEPTDKAEALNKELAPILKRASEIKVADPITYQLAGEEVKAMTALEKRVVAYWADDKKRADELHKSITKKEKDMLTPIRDRKASLTTDMKRWADQEEQKRLALEREAKELARKAAEDEALAIAAQLEKDGDKEQASAVISAPVAVAPVIIQKTTPTGFGSFTKKVWYAEVTDLMAMVKAVASGTAPLQAIQANESFLNNQAKQFTTGLRIPGVAPKWR